MKFLKRSLVFMIFGALSLSAGVGVDPMGINAAAKRDDVAHLKKVFEKYPHLLKKEERTLVFIAANNNSSAVLEYLKSQGVDVDKIIKGRKNIIFNERLGIEMQGSAIGGHIGGGRGVSWPIYRPQKIEDKVKENEDQLK